MTAALRLVRLVQADDRPGWDQWARFRVVDDAGPVGFVAEDRDWLGHTYGPPTYSAVHNPSGEEFGALWRSDGHPTPAEALAALVDHLGAS